MIKLKKIIDKYDHNIALEEGVIARSDPMQDICLAYICIPLGDVTGLLADDAVEFTS